MHVGPKPDIEKIFVPGGDAQLSCLCLSCQMDKVELRAYPETPARRKPAARKAMAAQAKWSRAR